MNNNREVAVMGLNGFDDTPGRVVKLTGPNRVSSPVKPTFRTHATQWNVVVQEPHGPQGQLRSRVIARVFLNRVGRFSAITDGPAADIRDFNTPAAAFEAVKRDYRRRLGL